MCRVSWNVTRHFLAIKIITVTSDRTLRVDWKDSKKLEYINNITKDQTRYFRFNQSNGSVEVHESK